MRQLLFAFMFLSVVLAEAQSSDEQVLARAGNVFISEREFLERFEMTPGLYRQRKGSLEEEKLVFLHSMIAEKMLAQEAVDRGLDQDSLYQTAMLEATKMLSRDALYHEEVQQKVRVSSLEIQEGVRRATKELLVSFLFLDNPTDADFARSRIRSSRDFAAMQFDSSLNVLRDTATVVWGTADTAIESAAYALNKGQVSQVVHAGDGFYILRVDRVKTNSFYTNMQGEVLRERVSSTLRTRKERVRMEEFVSETLKNASGFSPPKAFAHYARTVSEVFSANKGTDGTTMTRALADTILARCGASVGDTLIVAGPRVWTVRQATEDLLARGFTVQGDAARRTGRRLYDSFGEWVIQELLAQEALRRGMDRLPEVQKSLSPWRDQYLASSMKRKAAAGVAVLDAEAYAYLKSVDTAWSVPVVQIRELKTATLDQMRSAYRDLEQGASFIDVIDRWSVDQESRSRQGVTPFFPITERPPIGGIAWELNVGERYGPVRDSSGLVLFELLAKKRTDVQGDSARLALARKDVLAMKQKRKLTLFLAQVAARRTYDIYADRLQGLKVSPVPMMTYRLVGFGGRMFAVPFVEKNIEWVDTEPPREPVVP